MTALTVHSPLPTIDLKFKKPTGKTARSLKCAVALAISVALLAVLLPSFSDLSRQQSASVDIAQLSGHPVSDRMIELAENIDDFSVLVLSEEGGRQAIMSFESSQAPDAVTFQNVVPADGSIVVDEVGAVTILNARGQTVDSIAAPWAYDALGAPVPTWFEVSGNDLVQRVAHDASHQYPILADPCWTCWAVAGATVVIGAAVAAPVCAYSYGTACGQAVAAVGGLAVGAYHAVDTGSAAGYKTGVCWGISMYNPRIGEVCTAI